MREPAGSGGRSEWKRNSLREWACFFDRKREEESLGTRTFLLLGEHFDWKKHSARENALPFPSSPTFP